MTLRVLRAGGGGPQVCRFAANGDAGQWPLPFALLSAVEYNGQLLGSSLRGLRSRASTTYVARSGIAKNSKSTILDGSGGQR